MPPKVSEIWDRALEKFEEESRKATDQLKKGISRARNATDVERLFREAYERMNITFPSADELKDLGDQVASLSKRISKIESEHGITPKTRKKKKKKKKKSPARKKKPAKKKSSKKNNP